MLATFFSALTPLIVGVLGLYFTHLYKVKETEANRINQDRLELERQQRLLIDKATVIKDYFEYLANKADENQQRAALTVLATLGYEDLVIKVVTSDPTPSNLQALAAIAQTAADSDASNRAVGALDSIRQNAPTLSTAAAAEQALTTTQAAAPLPTGGPTFVVAGADKSLATAQVEVDKLKAKGFQDVEIVKRGDWYRTVVPVQQQSDANATLEQIKQTVRPSAYIVDRSKWCAGESAATECERPAGR